MVTKNGMVSAERWQTDSHLEDGADPPHVHHSGAKVVSEGNVEQEQRNAEQQRKNEKLDQERT